ncbi:MAG: hypothetical protein WA139_04320 [Candidatus Aenigmatarchaeota archaeon]
MEIKSQTNFNFLGGKTDIKEILKSVVSKKLSIEEGEREIEIGMTNDKVKKDFKKLKKEKEDDPETKCYCLFFDTHQKNYKSEEETRAKDAEKRFELLRDGKDITWIYVIRYRHYGKKCPYGNTGIVKSSDERFKNITA